MKATPDTPQAPAAGSWPAILGQQPPPGLLAVELEPADRQACGQRVSLYLREQQRIIRRQECFRPFMWIENEGLLQGCPVQVECQSLGGELWLKSLAFFDDWSDWKSAQTWLAQKFSRAADAGPAPYLALNDPLQQFCMLSGRTFFSAMAFEDLRRLQVDIETITAPGFDFCNAERASDRIIIIALGDESGWVETLADEGGGEKQLLEEFVRVVRERDPDVIEGHNIFNFDLPYLAQRAKLHRVPLALGRDGSLLRSRPGRFVAGERSTNFSRYTINGRHIVDTFFLLQIYDATHRALESLSLKEAARHFGLAAPQRVYLDSADMANIYARDPQRVLRYAADDIRETRALADVLTRSYFVQAQMLPMPYQDVCLRGNAAKIDALLLGAYLQRRHALPAPEAPRPFEGGYTDIFMRGTIRNVRHCDVRSLYPSIMLAKGLGPSSDTQGVFLKLLEFLRDYRLEAKRQMLSASTPAQAAHFQALQTAFKILINSFYGYLGFAQARFNDFEAAARVAAAGRNILRRMIKWLRAHGAQPVEIDTDGIYFVPPPFRARGAEEAFQRRFQKEALPAGIEVEFDGDYLSMFSYKMKNYALLEPSGQMIIRGAALKSRGLEPYLRAFLRDYLRLQLEARPQDIPALLERYKAELAQMPIRNLAKTEILKETPAGYAAKVAAKKRARNAAYELALRSGRPYQAGDRVVYYITGTKKNVAAHQAAKLVRDWDPQAPDTNLAYYIAKLEALHARLAATPDGEAEPL
ncbi:MAG: DNA polymerase II [Lentisphaerae bacterium]|nr:DNA polymerase II [Lentisphaerota bacterium]